MNPLHITIRLECSSLDIPSCLHPEHQLHWDLALGINVTSFQRVFKSIIRLQNNRSLCPLLPFLAGIVSKSTRTVSSENSIPCISATTFNESQLHAIQMATHEPVALIEGPPGTGNIFLLLFGLHNITH